MSNPQTLLAAHAVSRRFGGLQAVDEVSLSLERGVLHALIGTNGAGKSTLINVLSGELPVSGGRIELLGQDATNWTQPRRARAGLGRSYQRSTLFPSFTVRENCRLAAQARFPRAWDWITPAARCRDSLQAAESAIETFAVPAGAHSCALHSRLKAAPAGKILSVKFSGLLAKPAMSRGEKCFTSPFFLI